MLGLCFFTLHHLAVTSGGEDLYLRLHLFDLILLLAVASLDNIDLFGIFYRLYLGDIRRLDFHASSPIDLIHERRVPVPPSVYLLNTSSGCAAILHKLEQGPHSEDMPPHSLQ